mmetsp:Transcript_17837/g.20597  ORF Transcript_17837/g.20597 Transcript_17837/m.20597 type:complete len:153 (+) Transcript_17837:794-1252(+)
MQVFPKSVLIQSLDPGSGQLVLQFVNDYAGKDIVAYDQPCGRPICDDQLNFVVKDTTLDTKWSERFASEFGPGQPRLSDVLWLHQALLCDGRREVISSVKLTKIPHGSQLVQTQTDTNKAFYDIKSVRVRWGSSGNSCMHVFVNTTHIKRLE